MTFGLPQQTDILRVQRHFPKVSPRQHGREARAAFAINYDGNPDQDGRPTGPALQVLRLQSWYTPRHSKDGICFKDRQS
jgi:hypothetical protein